MSKSTTTTKQQDDAVQAPIALTLNEFCTRLSETVRRPELIAGFESHERRAGRLKDTPEAYRARFDAFLKAPV